MLFISGDVWRKALPSSGPDAATEMARGHSHLRIRSDLRHHVKCGAVWDVSWKWTRPFVESTVDGRGSALMDRADTGAGGRGGGAGDVPRRPAPFIRHNSRRCIL